jgi:uncharacterized protein DUF3830
MSMLRITAGPLAFTARMEEAEAPETCAAFSRILPFRSKIIQARWSGEAAWIPLGEFQPGVDYENHTSHPVPGHILFYPGGFSETEILFPLQELGRLVLWEGAQDIVFERLEGGEA